MDQDEEKKWELAHIAEMYITLDKMLKIEYATLADFKNTKGKDEFEALMKKNEWDERKSFVKRNIDYYQKMITKKTMSAYTDYIINMKTDDGKKMKEVSRLLMKVLENAGLMNNADNVKAAEIDVVKNIKEINLIEYRI